MSSLLYVIQDEVMEYAEIISRFLNVDVEVIDREHNRVAGTGIYKDKVNASNRMYGHGYRSVLSTGAPLVVMDPGNDSVCRNCSSRASCNIICEVGTPILYNGSIEGVLGIACCTPESKASFRQRLDQYIEFAEMIARLIAGIMGIRAMEQRKLSSRRLLDLLANSLSVCAIVLNSKSEAVLVNRNAIERLGKTLPEYGEHVNVVAVEDMGQRRRYKLTTTGGTMEVRGMLHLIDGEDEDHSRILLFDSAQYHPRCTPLVYEDASLQGVVGLPQNLDELRQAIAESAASRSHTMLTGEAGVEKHKVAYNIWKQYNNEAAPCLQMNCASLSARQIEECLFGSRADAQWGMSQNYIPVLQAARGGMLLLAEVHALPLHLQVQLETVLLENTLASAGGAEPTPLDVQLVTTTNANLREMARRGRFRINLYYLLAVSSIHLAPLAERKCEIEPLLTYYLQHYAHQLGKSFVRLESHALEWLADYPFSGNIPQLKSAARHMAHMMGADGVVGMRQLPQKITIAAGGAAPTHSLSTFQELEQREIKKALAVYGSGKNGKQKIAEALGISVATLYRKMEQYQFEKKDVNIRNDLD